MLFIFSRYGKSNWTLLFSLRLKYAQGTLQIRKSASYLLNSMIDFIFCGGSYVGTYSNYLNSKLIYSSFFSFDLVNI